MRNLAKIPVLLVVALAVVSCGKSEDKKISSQIAAKVDGDEISVHEINFALARSGVNSPDQAKSATPQILEKLVDRQLLVHKAIEDKLDRDPQVVLAIDAAKKQILAQAYIEKTMAGAQKSSDSEIKDFYDHNPELFAQRRIYRFQELAVNIAPDKIPLLQQEVEKDKNMNDIAVWLRSQNIAFNVNNAVKTAEQLPMELLPRLAKMKDGTISLIAGGKGGASVLQLVQSKDVPMNEQESKPAIEQYLLNRKRIEIAGAEVKKLREKAKIEYLGDFKAPAAAPSAPPAPPAVGAKPENSIDKGLSGLN
ncbi:MAG TPA: EpsD family peptidyl-prolyl cis-trans isomerase [Burkholderiales bacterium]|nr:EpsD family peptidyl-prolyl cis-trans isomerase [Burkholderiales bacterium]